MTLLTEARAALEGITPGEWGVFAPTQFDPLVVNSPTRDVCVLVTYDHRPDERERDAHFIAQAPSLVRRLCEEVERMSAKVADLEANAVRMREYRFALEGIATDGNGNLKETP